MKLTGRIDSHRAFAFLGAFGFGCATMGKRLKRRLLLRRRLFSRWLARVRFGRSLTGLRDPLEGKSGETHLTIESRSGFEPVFS